MPTLLLAFALAACDSDKGTEPSESIYNSADSVSASLGRELSFALLMQDVDPAASAESWGWVNQFTWALDLNEAFTACPNDLQVCLGYQRERIGQDIGRTRGARAQTLFEIQMDTALLALSHIGQDPHLASAFCHHMAARSATALLPESTWQPLCALPAGSTMDSVLDEFEATRDRITDWIETRVDDQAEFDANPIPFVEPGSDSADLSSND